MTTQQGANTPSNFDARADKAALALRASLNAKGRQVPDSAPVVVDKNGRPPAPLPPEGSYARQAIEAQRRAAEQQRKQLGDQPPAGTPEQAIDGSPAPRLPDSGDDTPPSGEQLSPNAERRIQQLVQQLRAKDQEYQQALAESKKNGESAAQLQQQFEALQQQHAQMLQANLEHLDPEERMRVMQDARMAQYFDHFEKRLIAKIQPQIKQLETAAQRTEMQVLADKYPSFDLEIHGPLIDMFRAKNPACTIEQAYRAIAEGDELRTRQSARAGAVPPVVAPGSQRGDAPRYAPTPTNGADGDPDAELREEAARIKKLRTSLDPNERRDGLRLMDEHLAKRLPNRFAPRQQ